MSHDIKKVLTPQDRIWVDHINRVFDEAIMLGKKFNPDKLYGDFQLLLEFLEGDEEAAGNYFLSYCSNVRSCPHGFLEFCEQKLTKAGVKLPPRSYEMPEAYLKPYLIAAE